MSESEVQVGSAAANCNKGKQQAARSAAKGSMQAARQEIATHVTRFWLCQPYLWPSEPLLGFPAPGGQGGAAWKVALS